MDERRNKIKLPRGISIRKHAHSSTICIAFTYKSRLCKEYLKLEPTKKNIEYAANLRGEIVLAIQRNVFNYAAHFPESKRARYFGHAAKNITVGQLLNKYLERAKKTLEKSTYEGYDRQVRAQLRPAFGKIFITDLSPRLIREYIEQADCTIKYMRNVLIPLRHVIEQAITDDIIEKNPLDKIFIEKLMPKQAKQKSRDINPFTFDEIPLFYEAANNYHSQMGNYFQFAIWSGLRPSEMFSLEWGNIDIKRNVVKVSNAIVLSEKKTTKTPSGVREIPLLPKANEALERQKEFTFLAKRRVFQNPNGYKPWRTDKQLHRIWKTIYSHCDKNLVKWHTPYQTRHTFASMMLMSGENLLTVAKMLGHKNIQMVINTYGQFIKDGQCASGYKLVNTWE